MLKKTTLKNLYSEIRKYLCYMIPEKWESIYLYASVIENNNNTTNGEMFFYYFPKSVIKKNPVNVYEIPRKFNINEEEYMKLVDKLYELIKDLRKECIKFDKEAWSNVTISIENVEFLVEYNYDELKNSVYTSDDRRIVWKYKYLDYPIEKLNKQEKEMLQAFLEEEEMGQHQLKVYSETFYQKHEHNNIEYDREKVEYIQEDNEVNSRENDNNENNNRDKVIKSQLLKLN